MAKSVFIQLTSAGADAGPFTITNNISETLATGVTRAALLTGVTYTMGDAATVVTVTSTGTCTNSQNITIGTNIVPVATPTPTSTPTPTPTPTISGTPAPTTLLVSWVKQAHMFTVSLNRAIGSDVFVNSVYADGFASSNCSTSAISSAADLRNILAIPAGSASYGWNPQTVCGGMSSDYSCWNTATNYTIYNVKINNQMVSNGGTVTIGTETVIVSFASCRTS